MSCHRPPASACWQSLLAVPLALFVFVLVLLYLFSPEAVSAQDRGVRAPTEMANTPSYDHETMAPTITASPLVGSIEVDGVLDEAAWLAAEVFSDFRQREPDDGEPVSERTEVRILAGPDALYIGAWMFDSEPDEIRATLVRRDVVSDFDYFIREPGLPSRSQYLLCLHPHSVRGLSGCCPGNRRRVRFWLGPGVGGGGIDG